jgi:hypothetical protein
LVSNYISIPFLFGSESVSSLGKPFALKLTLQLSSNLLTIIDDQARGPYFL